MSAPSQYGYNIRTATENDAAALELLFSAHLQALGATPDAELDADMANYGVVYSGPGKSLLLVDDYGTGLVGMAGLADGIIRRLFVTEKWRHLGIARVLVGSLILIHRKASSEPLHAVVADWNVPARRLFLSAGFKATGQFSQHPKLRGCELFRLEGITAPTQPV